MSNNRENVSSHWAGFRKLWIVIAVLLFLLLLLLLLLGYGPGGEKCVVPPTIVEKTVEVEKLVDNPKLINRITLLEKENTVIAGLQTKVAGLEKDNMVITGLNSTVAAFQASEPKLLSKIGLLEKDNAAIAGLQTKIAGLVKDNAVIAGLHTKISELQNAEPKIVEKIVEVEKQVDNPALLSKINLLEKENGLIAGLRAKIEEMKNAKPIIIEKIVEKIIEVPAAPIAPVAPIAPAKVMEAVMPDTAKLYFDVGSSEFPADINLSLSNVTSYLRNNPLSKAVISGFHDSTGNLAQNQELSLKRAQEVAKLLMDSGISADRMIINKPIESTGTGAPEDARRVEVKVMN